MEQKYHLRPERRINAKYDNKPAKTDREILREYYLDTISQLVLSPTTN